MGNNEALVAQLLAARAQIDAALMLLGVGTEPAVEEFGVCRHVPERRVTDRAGNWTCRDCGFTAGGEQ